MLSKIFLIAMTAFGAAVAAGCGEHTPPPADPAGAQASAAIPQRSGAQLWADNCSRCHNIRPPQSFSDTQWQTITHHMRLRANLTGEETRKITEFLQASH